MTRHSFVQLKHLLLLGLAAVVAAVTVWSHARTSFSIQASTAVLEIDTARDHRSSWVIDRGQVVVGYGSPPQSFIGTVRVRPRVRVVFERLVQGPLRISCKPLSPGESIAVLMERDAKTTTDITDRLVILLDRIQERAAEGRPPTFPFLGDIRVGRPMPLDAPASAPLLRSAQVTRLAAPLMGSDLFLGGTTHLDEGDSITLEGASSVAGFVLADERPALTVVARTVAERARVSRFGGVGYTISTSWLDRVRSDPWIQGFWSVVVAVSGYLGVKWLKGSS